MSQCAVRALPLQMATSAEPRDELMKVTVYWYCQITERRKAVATTGTMLQLS
jgi:hypothetical protein